jgi:hypothetical protein
MCQFSSIKVDSTRNSYWVNQKSQYRLKNFYVCHKMCQFSSIKVDSTCNTLMLVYHCHKPVFTPKIAIFQRAEMREGGLPLPLAFQYLILMIWRPPDLNLVMISSLASKCQHFKLRGLKFHSIKWLNNGHPNFKVLAFWSQWRYHDQIQIIRSSYQKNQILKS